MVSFLLDLLVLLGIFVVSLLIIFIATSLFVFAWVTIKVLIQRFKLKKAFKEAEKDKKF